MPGISQSCRVALVMFYQTCGNIHTKSLKSSFQIIERRLVTGCRQRNSWYTYLFPNHHIWEKKKKKAGLTAHLTFMSQGQIIRYKDQSAPSGHTSSRWEYDGLSSF